MSVDPKIKEAIEPAVEEAGQTPSLARCLGRWFEAIATGNENINDRQSADRHLELLYDETQTHEEQMGEEVEELLEDQVLDEESSFGKQT